MYSRGTEIQLVRYRLARIGLRDLRTAEVTLAATAEQLIEKIYCSPALAKDSANALLNHPSRELTRKVRVLFNALKQWSPSLHTLPNSDSSDYLRSIYWCLVEHGATLVRTEETPAAITARTRYSDLLTPIAKGIAFSAKQLGSSEQAIGRKLKRLNYHLAFLLQPPTSSSDEILTFADSYADYLAVFQLYKDAIVNSTDRRKERRQEYRTWDDATTFKEAITQAYEQPNRLDSTLRAIVPMLKSSSSNRLEAFMFLWDHERKTSEGTAHIILIPYIISIATDSEFGYVTKAVTEKFVKLLPAAMSETLSGDVTLLAELTKETDSCASKMDLFKQCGGSYQKLTDFRAVDVPYYWTPASGRDVYYPFTLVISNSRGLGRVLSLAEFTEIVDAIMVIYAKESLSTDLAAKSRRNKLRSFLLNSGHETFRLLSVEELRTRQARFIAQKQVKVLPTSWPERRPSPTRRKHVSD